MAKKTKRDDEASDESEAGFIRSETKHGILAIICFALTIFFVLASLGFAGLVGSGVFDNLNGLVGVGYFGIPLVALLLGISFSRSGRPNLITSRLISALVSFLAILGLVGVAFRHSLESSWSGGWLGQKIAALLFNLFASYSIILLLAIVIIAQLVMFDVKPDFKKFSPLYWWRRLRGEKINGDQNNEDIAKLKVAGGAGEIKENKNGDESDRESADKKLEKKKAEMEGENEAGIFGKLINFGGRSNNTSASEFVPPPLALLEKDSGKPTAGDVKAQANIIKRTLANFGIVVEMDEVAIGPSITRFAFKPAEGVKLSRIVALQNDLSLALAAHPLRIEAPIPGKSLVGIEIPNSTKATVGLASLVGNRDFIESPHPLYVSLGRGITGTSHFANLARAPHILIAGTTGSGKSVVIHTFITSLLYRNAPERLRFIMIDPKRVELTMYNKIPHLLTPVVTDPKRAILVLKWAIKEMERRYNILESNSVRDIQSYHKNAGPETAETEKMPYIVIIIDELADIMSTYPRELEAAIVRLAQMSRAVGIHLVLSTQRPSVEVITGLIKANIPSRVALQVASQIDSRTILDMAGAEKLLGAGDMLYLAGDMAKPIRLQSAFISETEVKKVTEHITKAYQDELGDEILLTTGGAEMTDNGKNATIAVDWEAEEATDDEDEMYEEARELVIKEGKASASYLQRRLKVGYARAARLLDMLEERGVIGPGDGAKQREVYLKDETQASQF